MLRIRLLVLTAVLAVVGGEEDELPPGVSQYLAGLGESLFGTPDAASGAAVSQWREGSASNPEELGAYTQGDILFPYTAASRNGLKSLAARWPRATVHYVISGPFSNRDRAMIDKAIQEYHRLTCVRFVPRTNEKDYVDITSSNTGCWSSVGRVGGRQELNLQSPGCLSKLGTVMHEMMHALGFLHEQNRWERDDYVTVNYYNIEPGRENNFEKAKKSTTDSLGVQYDYHSVMHYSANAFSVNGQPTITANKKGVTLGQRDNLSKMDLQKIRRMYKCKKTH